MLGIQAAFLWLAALPPPVRIMPLRRNILPIAKSLVKYKLEKNWEQFGVGENNLRNEGLVQNSWTAEARCTRYPEPIVQ
jgi:hypothetical protein